MPRKTKVVGELEHVECAAGSLLLKAGSLHERALAAGNLLAAAVALHSWLGAWRIIMEARAAVEATKARRG